MVKVCFFRYVLKAMDSLIAFYVMWLTGLPGPELPSAESPPYDSTSLPSRSPRSPLPRSKSLPLIPPRPPPRRIQRSDSLPHQLGVKSAPIRTVPQGFKTSFGAKSPSRSGAAEKTSSPSRKPRLPLGISKSLPLIPPRPPPRRLQRSESVLPKLGVKSPPLRTIPGKPQTRPPRDPQGEKSAWVVVWPEIPIRERAPSSHERRSLSRLSGMKKLQRSASPFGYGGSEYLPLVRRSKHRSHHQPWTVPASRLSSPKTVVSGLPEKGTLIIQKGKSLGPVESPANLPLQRSRLNLIRGISRLNTRNFGDEKLRPAGVGRGTPSSTPPDSTRSSQDSGPPGEYTGRLPARKAERQVTGYPARAPKTPSTWFVAGIPRSRSVPLLRRPLPRRPRLFRNNSTPEQIRAGAFS